MTLDLWDEILKDDPIARGVLANPLDTTQLSKLVELYHQVKDLEQKIQCLEDMYKPGAATTINTVGNRTWDLLQALVAGMNLDMNKHNELKRIMQQSAHHIGGNSPRSS